MAGDVANDLTSAEPPLPPPPPLPQRWVDLRPMVAVGTALWFVAFCGLLVARLAFHTRPTELLWICLAGWIVGLFGASVMYWQRAASRRGSRGAQQV